MVSSSGFRVQPGSEGVPTFKLQLRALKTGKPGPFSSVIIT